LPSRSRGGRAQPDIGKQKQAVPKPRQVPAVPSVIRRFNLIKGTCQKTVLGDPGAKVFPSRRTQVKARFRKNMEKGFLPDAPTRKWVAGPPWPSAACQTFETDWPSLTQ